ncbi:MAG: hypothetical protein JJT94_11705 [Bernardetiaceae bacterium]|nr:hypothetical protein [Bernardetiaceae bacterium]
MKYFGFLAIMLLFFSYQPEPVKDYADRQELTVTKRVYASDTLGNRVNFVTAKDEHTTYEFIIRREDSVLTISIDSSLIPIVSEHIFYKNTSSCFFDFSSHYPIYKITTKQNQYIILAVPCSHLNPKYYTNYFIINLNAKYIIRIKAYMASINTIGDFDNDGNLDFILANQGVSGRELFKKYVEEDNITKLYKCELFTLNNNKILSHELNSGYYFYTTWHIAEDSIGLFKLQR